MNYGLAEPPAVSGQAGATARDLLRSAYDWESDRETITLGAAVQRFRDVNGYARHAAGRTGRTALRRGADS